MVRLLGIEPSQEQPSAAKRFIKPPYVPTPRRMFCQAKNERGTEAPLTTTPACCKVD